MDEQQFVEHLTTDGDRWDLLAYDYYGDPYAYEPIIRANPAHSFTTVLEGGRLLRIPVVEAAIADVDDALLPPWKRR